MKFSLIVATINRVEPLDLLFRSLCIQTYKNFEVILVDQNTKGQLDGLVNKYAEKLDIKRIFSEKGLSKARNRGLDMADGDIVCFPDDDCWYYPNTLEIVKSKFSKNQSVFGFTGRCIDDDGNESVAKFVKYRTI
ncbi:glycosyltransferase family A protein, partial [Aeromonas hydrophila]|uniref:glycosyltransferase family A protein n=2 Tax=Aeromonadaceae TaxID=84642 RepID=UPI002B05EA17